MGLGRRSMKGGEGPRSNSCGGFHIEAWLLEPENHNIKCMDPLEYDYSVWQRGVQGLGLVGFDVSLFGLCTFVVASSWIKRFRTSELCQNRASNLGTVEA